jgi:hypothetical protein
MNGRYVGYVAGEDPLHGFRCGGLTVDRTAAVLWRAVRCGFVGALAEPH